MKRIIGITILVLGVLFILFGLNASDSISSDISRAVTGNPTDRTLWLMISGAAMTVVGSLLALSPKF